MVTVLHRRRATGDGGARHRQARRAAAGSHETPTRDRARAFQNSKLSAFLRAPTARAHTCDSRDLSVKHDTMRYLLLPY